jgi:hypothetical protein
MVDGPQESMTVTYVRAAAVGYDPFLKFGKPMEGVNTCTDTRCFLAVHTLFLFVVTSLSIRYLPMRKAPGIHSPGTSYIAHIGV